jgi:acetolactate synthase I/II/III large subunit
MIKDDGHSIMTKASDLFVKCLEEEGVEYIFGLPGEETNDLMRPLLDSKKIKFILVRHEQAAAFMADVYGRITQKVGVCLSTLGPGATNLTTGVANANMDRSPILAITAQTDSNLLDKESHQNMDAVTMFKPITKWSWSFRNANSIPEIIRRAFKISLEEKAGAVHLVLPRDIAKQNSTRCSCINYITCLMQSKRSLTLDTNNFYVMIKLSIGACNFSICLTPSRLSVNWPIRSIVGL